jgi:LysR family glycine cleavage system transcriptional activator
MTVDTAPRPSLLALRTLVEVATSGSLTNAAESLGVTLSAVSRQVSQLETALGAQLLERGSRPVVLSPIGRRYADALKPAFEAVDRAT